MGLQKIYSDIANRYELANHFFTLCLDFLWRRKAVRIASEGGGTMWLDICTGTGEMALNLKKVTGDDTTIVASDFSLPMLHQATLKPGADCLNFTLGDANVMPFKNGTFDLVIISFATRNLNPNREALTNCFREFHRILKPGGRFINLETSQPRSAFIRTLFHSYTRISVNSLGFALSGNREGYNYLASSISRFHGAEELAVILKEAGFSKVEVNKMMFGITAIHTAFK